MAIKKILIVDDSSTDLLNLKEAVTGTGTSIITATSGKEAVTKAKSEKPDLIFMDIVMEEVDGYKACRQLQEDEETKNIPVIFVSSKHQRADRLWAEKQGGRGFITKPYTKEDIIEQIKIFS
jgi:twitching motility two-component system response regulator PilH